MPEFSDIQQVSTMAASDTFVITQGAKSRQISNADALAGLGVVFANTLVATSSYTLVAQSTAPITMIVVDGFDVTIPNDTSFTQGSIYIAVNTDTGDEPTINLATGVTATNISDGVTTISSPSTDDGSSYGVFINVGQNEWQAFGDFSGAA